MQPLEKLLVGLRAISPGRSTTASRWCSEARYGPWLSTDTSLAEEKGMPRPYPAEEMEATTVGPAINSSRNEGPELLNSA